MKIEDQPPPNPAAEGVEVWPAVLEDLDERLGIAEGGKAIVVLHPPGLLARALLADAAEERDRIGRARYGTPLRAGNGREALADAAQEALDLCAYLRQRIEEDRTAGHMDVELVRLNAAALYLAAGVLSALDKRRACDTL